MATEYGVKHAYTATVENNSNKGVSSTRWNDGHAIKDPEGIGKAIVVIDPLSGEYVGIYLFDMSEISRSEFAITACQAVANTTAVHFMGINGFRMPSDLIIKSTLLVTEKYNGKTRLYDSNGMVLDFLFSRGGQYAILSRWGDTGEYVFDLATGAASTQDDYGSAITDADFGYGTYEWTGTMDDDSDQGMLFGFELHHGRAGDGLIAFNFDGSDFFTQTKADDTAENSDPIIAFDPTEEHTYKIDWSAAGVKFYIDGTLIENHTLHFPTDPCGFFIEIYPTGSATSEHFYIKMKGLKEVTT